MMMKPPELKSTLIELRLHHLAQNLDDLVARWTKSRLGPREIVEDIVQKESEDRRRRTVEGRLHHARIGRFKPLADFDWSWPTAVDRSRVESLMNLEFLPSRENVILAGAEGLGKTMIAQNIAYTAVLAGHTTLFTTASNMLADLSQQESSRALQARIRRYIRPKLLVIDEVGYLSYDARMADLFFEIISRRYEKGSILLTTNLGFQDWPKHFPGAACVTALLDRLTHHAEILAIEGRSFRLKEAEDRKAKRKGSKMK